MFSNVSQMLYILLGTKLLNTMGCVTECVSLHLYAYVQHNLRQIKCKG